MSYAERKKIYHPKTVLLYRDADADLIKFLQRPGFNASEWIRGRLREALERERAGGPGLDPAAIQAAVEASLDAKLGDIRQVVQTALDAALEGAILRSPPATRPDDDTADILAAMDAALEVE